MGRVTAEITLSNPMDKVRVQEGIRSRIREVTVTAIVDTGASTIIINEELQQQLGLEIEGKRRTTFADGGQKECGLTEGIKIHWKNRHTTCNAVVIPGAKSVLLGAIPLEDMDLIINPLKQELIGAHGEVVEALAL
ncbi:hypothetical protein AGMMS50230_18770 [Spirochaetia bacterium]|nr:hypothetical protein AGMMS50230_18770 [Spirochaetia bacterium]